VSISDETSVNRLVSPNMITAPGTIRPDLPPTAGRTNRSVSGLLRSEKYIR
jgi:hypothetical protein